MLFLIRYKEGKILSMSASSGLAVQLLEIKANDHILDLCCAPGLKLIYAGLKLGNNGSITGVDSSKDRLCITRSLVKKYKVNNVRLFVGDGRYFKEAIHEISHDKTQFVTYSEVSTYKQQFKTRNHSIYLVILERSQDFYKVPFSTIRFDSFYLLFQVIVDAQCTHDGSVVHVLKNVKNKWLNHDLDQYDEIKLENLYQLQLDLIVNGFKNLRIGGILIYCTCR